MAVTATSRRLAFVFFLDNQLVDWKMAQKATRSTALAAEALQREINDFKPDAVVTEQLDQAKPKQQNTRTRKINTALTRLAAENYVLDVSVPSIQRYANRFEEAEALARRYPAVKAWVPQRRKFWQSEPARIALFKALRLADDVLKRPTTTLAAAMK